MCHIAMNSPVHSLHQRAAAVPTSRQLAGMHRCRLTEHIPRIRLSKASPGKLLSPPATPAPRFDPAGAEPLPGPPANSSPRIASRFVRKPSMSDEHKATAADAAAIRRLAEAREKIVEQLSQVIVG